MTHQNKAILLVALLVCGWLTILWVFTRGGGFRTRRVSRDMEWIPARQSWPPFSPERSLPDLPEGAVRLRFVDAPNTFLVADYPGLLAALQRLGKKEISVEFEVTCGLSGGKPRSFRETSIAGVNVDNLPAGNGGMESIGQDPSPFSGICNWW